MQFVCFFVFWFQCYETSEIQWWQIHGQIDSTRFLHKLIIILSITMASSPTNYNETNPLLGRHRTRLESGGDNGSDSYVRSPNPSESLYGLSRPKRRAACSAIVATEMFERLAFYGFTANMVLFLNGQPFMWLSYEAANTLLVFLGVTYMWSVIGGWIADTMLGRFKTILLSFIIYMCGAALLVLIGYGSTKEGNHMLKDMCGERRMIQESIPVLPGNVSHVSPALIWKPAERQHYCGRVIWPALLLIAVGTGLIISNLSPFGADQVIITNTVN